jgi:pectate lyase
VFDVSGVIEGPVEVKHGQLTIAGQTAPGGITVAGGLVCDNVYDPNDCNDLVIRHVRFRKGAPDSLRIGGAHDVIIDHCSMAAADDENLELTRSRDVTIQRSIIAEPSGDHYQWGGLLINYSKDVLPLDRLAIHHTVWNGVAGRLPEISCEENGDGPGRSNCAGHVLHLELSNNVLWDASDPIWFNHCTGNNQGNDCPTAAKTFALSLNLVGNVMARRSSADGDAPLVEPAVYTHRGGVVHSAGNVLLHGSVAHAADGSGVSAPRQPFPAITYTSAGALVAQLARAAGPFPRDHMDERLASYLARPVDARPAAWRDGRGVDAGDALGRVQDAAPLAADSDGDGMPDAWESAHGLDPRVPDGTALGRAKSCHPGYAALECYVNELADTRVPR